MSTFLRFIDCDRQHYSDRIPAREAGEFMVGAYDDGDGGVDHQGEFKIVLHDFAGTRGLAPQLCVFGEAQGALKEFIRLGGLDVLAAHTDSTEQLSRRLSALGIPDRSDRPFPEVKA